MKGVDAFIHFLIKYNEKIIYVLGGAICFLSAVIVWWQVFGKKGLRQEGVVQVDLSGIEDSLKKILGQTHSAMGLADGSGAGADAAAGAAATLAGVALSGLTGIDGKPLADAGAVKAELEKRASIIEELRSEVKAAKEQDSSGDLLAKIKGLEGRLSEYEIIEDDIADLSVLKEENAKLKKELENMQRGGPQMVDQFAAAVAQAEGQPAAPASASVTSTAPSPITQSAATAAAPARTPAAAPPDKPLVVASPVMAGGIAGADEMASAVAAAQAQLDASPPDGQVVIGAETSVVASAAPPPAPEAAAPVAAAPVVAAAAAPPAPAAEVPKGDIFGEFAGDSENENDPLAALGDIDPDKMLDELKDLNIESSVGAEALDQAPDIDKMAEEAASLEDKKG